MSYSNRSEEQKQKQGHKKETIKNTIVRDQREKSNAHWNDQWAFLQFPYLLAGLLDYEQARNRPETGF